MKSKELEEFLNEICIPCKEQCNEGLRETYDFVRCIDRNITKKKNVNIEVKNNV